MSRSGLIVHAGPSVHLGLPLLFASWGRANVRQVRQSFTGKVCVHDRSKAGRLTLLFAGTIRENDASIAGTVTDESKPGAANVSVTARELTTGAPGFGRRQPAESLEDRQYSSQCRCGKSVSKPHPFGASGVAD